MTPAFDQGLAGLLPELRWRGMFHAASEGLEARLATERQITAYNGFDPSGPWLHIGHLVPIFGLIHLQRHGGRPIALVGGGTGMIGDPSGRSSERNLQSADVIEANAASMRGQLEHFLDFDGPNAARMENNLRWLEPIRLLDFLRDVGKHFTVPYMLAKDSVQVRLEGGLSFTEFSYMLIQAADFQHLHRELGCELQMGGADQWGNITAGLELIRRTSEPRDGWVAQRVRAGVPAAARAVGRQVREVGERRLRLAPPRRDVAVRVLPALAEHGRPRHLDLPALVHAVRAGADRGARGGDRGGAREARGAARARVRHHGARPRADAARAGEVAASEAAFSGGRSTTRRSSRRSTARRAASRSKPRTQVAGLVGLLVAVGIFASRGEARRMIQNGGLTMNDERVTDPEAPVPPLLAGEWLVVRVGKRKLHIGRRRGG